MMFAYGRTLLLRALHSLSYAFGVPLLWRASWNPATGCGIVVPLLNIAMAWFVIWWAFLITRVLQTRGGRYVASDC